MLLKRSFPIFAPVIRLLLAPLKRLPCRIEPFKSLTFLREVFKKKNVYKAVRLTAWVDPPSPSPEAVRKM